jgi:hypothetical protein
MSQNLCDEIHKFFITEEELNSGGPSMNTSNKTGNTSLKEPQQKTPVRQNFGHHDTPRAPAFSTPHRPSTKHLTPYRAQPYKKPHHPQKKQ